MLKSTKFWNYTTPYKKSFTVSKLYQFSTEYTKKSPRKSMVAIWQVQSDTDNDAMSI